jgi:hypothetical protein
MSKLSELVKELRAIELEHADELEAGNTQSSATLFWR